LVDARADSDHLHGRAEMRAANQFENMVDAMVVGKAQHRFHPILRRTVDAAPLRMASSVLKTFSA